MSFLDDVRSEVGVGEFIGSGETGELSEKSMDELLFPRYIGSLGGNGGGLE